MMILYPNTSAGSQTRTGFFNGTEVKYSITATENFILGFRLGVRLMAECMDNNDGDIRTGGE